jgi:signal transduction histidine kinase
VYGFGYVRSTVVSAIAGSVYREVPLLPVSFAGTRWNYDTTRVRNGEVLNDSLLAMRVRDRLGRLLWKTPDADVVLSKSPYGARTVLSTAAGGFVVEAAMRPVAGKSLIPTIVRSTQRWTLRALIALALLLVVVSLIALRGERQDAHARRVEGMQQLALGLRHEINNALASMLLNAELLNEEQSLTAEQHERLDAIVEQAERMRKVVRRLERSDKLDVVPYLNEGLMVDLSTTKERDVISEFSPRPRDPG